MVNYGLENRVALITGANNPQGIGATTAVAFAREGAKVAIVYNVMCPVRQAVIIRNNQTYYDHIERVTYTYGLAV